MTSSDRNSTVNFFLMIQQILQLNEVEFPKKDTFLRKRSDAVIQFNSDLHQTIKNLTDTINFHEIAVGLSAVQVGILQRVFVVDLNKIEAATGQKQRESGVIAFVNPEILSVSKKSEKQMEACMSLPMIQGEIERPSKITVAYQTQTGVKKTIIARGLLARVILHEIDHFEGILYIDRMPPDGKLFPFDPFSN